MTIPAILWPVLLTVSVAIQLFYYLYFFRRLAFYKPPVKPASQEYPVSIIVCARDEAHNLANNLPGVLVQEYKTTHEIIVVNDNSVDDTRFLMDEFYKSFKNLNHLRLTHEAKLIPGKKYPLSMGIKAAKYEIVLLTDADCVPASEHWLQRMQDGFADGTDIVLGYGAYYKKPGLLNKIIRFETFHSALQYLSFALAGNTYMGVGRNLSYKKDLFFRNKGFSSLNHIPSGDDDLFIHMVATKKNTAIVIEKEAHTISNPHTTWKGWVRQKFRHYTTAKYYKPKVKFLLGLYSFTHITTYALLAAAIIFFNWWVALAIYAVKLVAQAVIWKKAMHELNEDDLWPLFVFWDVWMFFYYILFATALWKKPAKNWR